jgi:hypothetical protein
MAGPLRGARCRLRVVLARAARSRQAQTFARCASWAAFGLAAKPTRRPAHLSPVSPCCAAAPLSSVFRSSPQEATKALKPILGDYYRSDSRNVLKALWTDYNLCRRALLPLACPLGGGVAGRVRDLGGCLRCWAGCFGGEGCCQAPSRWAALRTCSPVAGMSRPTPPAQASSGSGSEGGMLASLICPTAPAAASL